MADLTPVSAPRSPFVGWRGWVVSIVVIGILLAIAKPWGTPPADVVLASPEPLPTAVPVVVAPVGQTYDPEALGKDVPAAAWALMTPTGRRSLDMLGFAPDDVADEPAADDTPIVSGPVVDLGTTDDLGVFAVTHPSDVSLATIRLWRFVDGGAPRRVDLGTMIAPWAISYAEVLAHRQPSMDADRVLPWDAGLYRLDLLIEPAGRVRSIMLSVRQGRTASTTTDAGDVARADRSFEQSALRLLPESANVWSVGRFLSGWYRESARPGCRVAEIWRSTDPSDDCWPIPLGGTDAIGVNLPDGEVVTGIELRAVDPLPGPAGAETMLAVDGRPGTALVRAPAGGMPDGIYRLDVTTDRGAELMWFFEIGPLGRTVAQYYQSSLSR